MTEYEAAHLFKELLEGMHNASINYVTVLFAFLVAGYMVAARLNKTMTGILVGLFSFFSLVMIFIANRTMASITGLVEQLRKASANGDTALDWHPVVYQPANYGEIIMTVYTVLLLISYMAGLVFFFNCRRGGVGFSQNMPD